MSEFDPSAPAQGDGIFGLPQTAEEARIILIPVPWEPTTSYGRGTARGPAGIRVASQQVDLYDAQTGKPYEAGIHMLEEDGAVVRWNREACSSALPVIAVGGEIEGDAQLERLRAHVDELSEQLNQWVYDETKRWLGQDHLVGIVGGDHSVPFGAIRAHLERFPGLGILHIDAHADFREAYEGFSDSHASIMFNVLSRLPLSPLSGAKRLVQVGIRDFSEEEKRFSDAHEQVVTFYDDELFARAFEGTPFSKTADEIVGHLPHEVYVSLDIDGLDPTLCPHTGTPVPGGLSFPQLTYLLDRLVRSGRKIVGFDIVEVAPGPDGDEWDANIGARVLYKLIGFALASEKHSAPR